MILFGLALPAFGSAKLYNKFFKRMEEQTIAQAIKEGKMPAQPGSEDEHIFSDELNPALENKKEEEK